MWKFAQIPTRGLYASLPDDSIPEGYWSDGLNIRMRYGVVLPRPGFVQLASTTTHIPRWFGRFTNDSGTTFTLMLTDDALYRLNAGAWTQITGAIVGSGNYGVAMGLGRFFFTRPSSNGVFYWDGNIANAIVQLTDSDSAFGGAGTNVPYAYFLEFFNDRLWLIRSNESKTVRTRWSVSANSGNWDTTAGGGFLDLYDDLAEPLTCGRSLGGRLSIYKRRSIIDVIPTGLTTPTHTSEVRVRGVGCVAPYTLVSTGQEHFFLGEDNVYAWDGSQVRAIGKPIQQRLLQLFRIADVNTYFGAIAEARTEYYLYIGNNTCFVYDYAKDIWYLDQYVPSTGTLTALGSADKDSTVYNWSGAPAAITGTWLAHPETWLDVNMTTTPAFLGGSSNGGSCSSFYATETVASDLGSSMRCRLVTRRMYLNDDPTRAIALKRAMLLHQNTATGSVDAEAYLSPETYQLVTKNMSAQGRTYFDYNATGQSLRMHFTTLGTLFEWRMFGLDIEDGGLVQP